MHLKHLITIWKYLINYQFFKTFFYQVAKSVYKSSKCTFVRSLLSFECHSFAIVKIHLFFVFRFLFTYFNDFTLCGKLRSKKDEFAVLQLGLAMKWGVSFGSENSDQNLLPFKKKKLEKDQNLLRFETKNIDQVCSGLLKDKRSLEDKLQSEFVINR